MDFYGQFPKSLRSLMDDVEDSESKKEARLQKQMLCSGSYGQNTDKSSKSPIFKRRSHPKDFFLSEPALP